MKKINFFAFALTLLMGISFTSCLDSDNEGGYDTAGYVRISSSFYGVQLKDLAGNIYIPTTASVAALKQQGVDLNSTDYDLVYVYLKWVEETTTKAGTSRQVELVAASPVSKGKGAYPVTSMENLITSNEAPVVTLEPMGAYGSTAKPWLYGSELMVLPIQWKMKNDKEMLKQHTFSLYYISGNQDDQDDKTMTFYLLHDKGTDNAEKNSLVDAANNFSFDIKSYMDSYKAQNGAYPSRVVVKAKVALDGFTLPIPGEDGTGKVWTDYEIDASFLNKNTK